MRTWMTEHGAEFDVPEAELRAAGFIDMSWGNESCPHFSFPEDRTEPRLALWVDHPDRTRRENDGCRFTLAYCPEGYGTVSVGYEEFQTDSLAEVLSKAKEWRERINPRFIYLLPCNKETFPDLPDPVDGQHVLWDRQEKKPVFIVFGEYAQAACLETYELKGGEKIMDGSPFSLLETWWNDLSNAAMESEGIVPTKEGYERH